MNIDQSAFNSSDHINVVSGSVNYERQVSDHEIEVMTRPVINKPMPYISGKCVLNGKIQEVDMEWFRSGHYLVIFFLGIETIQKEILQLKEWQNIFQQENISFVCVSTDQVFSILRKTKEQPEDEGYGICSFPIISDLDFSISRSYECLCEDGPYAGSLMSSYFVVSPKGLLRFY